MKFESWLDHFDSPTHCIDNYSFGNLISTCFHHHHLIIFHSDYEIKIRSFAFFWTQEGLKFTIHATDTYTGNWSVKRYAGIQKSRRSSHHRNHIWTEVWVHRKYGSNHLNFLAITFREEWANRTIDQTADQNRFIGWFAFTLNKLRARDLTRSIELFFVINREWEKILHHRFFTDDHGAENYSVTIGNKNRAGSAKTDTINFNRELLTTKISRQAKGLLASRVDNIHIFLSGKTPDKCFEGFRKLIRRLPAYNYSIIAQMASFRTLRVSTRGKICIFMMFMLQ